MYRVELKVAQSQCECLDYVKFLMYRVELKGGDIGMEIADSREFLMYRVELKAGSSTAYFSSNFPRS